MTCMFYCDFTNGSFAFCPEQVPSFYRPSTVKEKDQTTVVWWWHVQSCPKTRLTDGSCIFCGRTMVLSKLVSLSPWASTNILPTFDSSRKKSRIVSRWRGQSCPETLSTDMTYILYSAFTMISPEFVRLLSWTSANILPAFDSSENISNERCFVMTRTISSRDSANWWLMDSILDIPWSCLSSFNSSPE